MTMDIKDFYLNAPMAQYKYMQLQIANMPDDVIKQYQLTNLATLDRYVSVRFRKECTAYHMPGSLPSNCLRNDFKNTDTTKSQQPLVCGNMANNQFPSPLLWTTLG